MRLLLVVNLATEQQSQSNNALIRCYLFAFWFLLSNLERTNENIGSLEAFSRGKGRAHAKVWSSWVLYWCALLVQQFKLMALFVENICYSNGSNVLGQAGRFSWA